MSRIKPWPLNKHLYPLLVSLTSEVKNACCQIERATSGDAYCRYI